LNAPRQRRALPAAVRAAAVAALAALLAGALVAAWGDGMLRHLLPLLRWALLQVEPAFAVQHLDIVQTPAGSRIRTQVMLAHSVVVGGRVVMPHPLGQAFAWVPAFSVWMLPLLAATTAAAWPVRHAAEWPLRAAALLLALPLLMLLDTPFVVVAEFWRALMQAHDPRGWQAHVLWADFLRGGGRVCLAVLCAAAAVALARRWTARPARD
jgi:hypothetical protein